MESLTQENLVRRRENHPHLKFQDLHSLSKANKACLVRIFLPEPGSGSKSSDLRVGGGKQS